VDDVLQHRGRSIIIAGDEQPPEVHALVHAMNDRLGNSGATISYIEPVEANPVQQTQSIRALTQDMAADRVSTLIILSGNPSYTAPADLEFSRQLTHVPLRIQSSLYFDETSRLCHWHIPETHYLESWGDVQAFDGTTSIIQPLIIPLYDSR